VRIFILAIFFLAGTLAAFSQPVATIGEKTSVVVADYELLPDQGYSFKKILTDSSLLFTANDSLRPSTTNCYWLKFNIKNSSNYDRPYRLRVLPNINNTLFYFDEDTHKWMSQSAGQLVKTDKSRTKGLLPVTLQGGKQTTLYVQVNIGQSAAFEKPCKPQLVLEQVATRDRQENLLALGCIVSLAVLFIVFINNLHVYFSFRDRTVLYFLVGQLGGMIYIISYRYYFKVLFFFQPFTGAVQADGIVNLYDYSSVLMHLSVALILFGFIQFTRSYLHTRQQLPALDAVLKYGIIGYLLFTVVVGAINVFWFYADGYTLRYDNLFVGLLILAIVVTSIAGYRQKLPSAAAFLLANLLPLLLMMSLALYHVLINVANDGQLILPDLAIISQAICFSVAIVSRVRIVRENLALKEAEAQQLAFDIREMEFRHREIMLENEQINASCRELELRQQLQEIEAKQLSENILLEKNANKGLQEKLESNSRELASTTLYMVQKNELLAKLKKQIEELNKLSPGSKHQELDGIHSILQSNLYLDDDWHKFKLHFEQVHPNFFAEVSAQYPSLTKNELRLYSYFHINLSTKEIAALLNIDPASVRRAKSRLYKKIGTGESKETSKPTEDEMSTGFGED
jgi:DNA-binding CsgD family transcriptional regulator